MDNANSQVKIQLPSIPSNVEALLGTSKSDFLEYIKEWIAGAQITGINEQGAVSLEVSTLTKNVTSLETRTAALEVRKPQKISIAGTNGTLITVPLAEALPSNLYDVSGVFVGGSGALADIGWAVVSGSKTTSEFQVRIQGDATAYSLDLTVTPTSNL